MLLLAATTALVACSKTADQSKAMQTPKNVATIHELMEHIMEPTADKVWDSTAILTDETGVHDNWPTTDAQWEELRGQAVMLTEVPNLVAMPGRKVVPDGETISPGGTLTAAEIQKKIDEHHDEFAANAAALQAVAVKALQAIDRRDRKALDQAGGEIDQVCEACHLQFYYPPKPGTKS